MFTSKTLVRFILEVKYDQRIYNNNFNVVINNIIRNLVGLN